MGVAMPWKKLREVRAAMAPEPSAPKAGAAVGASAGAGE
jgi:hypothetical protein